MEDKKNPNVIGSIRYITFMPIPILVDRKLLSVNDGMYHHLFELQMVG